MKYKRFLFLSVGMLMVVVTMLSLATQTVFAQQEAVDVAVCHYNPGNGGVIVVVSVHSVDDANGLNGHGGHGNDSWASFEFGGVTYPGQGDVSNCQAEEPEEDLCSNIEGVQEIIPDGYILNNEGLCVPEEEEIDLCLNLEGTQTEIPAGYLLEGEGQCVPEEETLDVCPNLEGDQGVVPAGMFINNDGQCVVEETPPPPSSSTTTSTTTRFLIPVTGVDLAGSSGLGLSLAGLAMGLGMVIKGLTIKK